MNHPSITLALNSLRPHPLQGVLTDLRVALLHDKPSWKNNGAHVFHFTARDTTAFEVLFGHTVLCYVMHQSMPHVPPLANRPNGRLLSLHQLDYAFPTLTGGFFNTLVFVHLLPKYKALVSDTQSLFSVPGCWRDLVSQALESSVPCSVANASDTEWSYTPIKDIQDFDAAVTDLPERHSTHVIIGAK